MNNKISHFEGLQRTTPDESGAQTSTYCTRTFCLPPTTFLFLWLWNEIHFAGVKRHKNNVNNMIFDQNEQQNISFERVAENNTR
jgi:hypothetical protein